MEDNQEHELTINNASYGSFNGFKVKFVGFKKIPYRFSIYGWPGGKCLDCTPMIGQKGLGEIGGVGH